MSNDIAFATTGVWIKGAVIEKELLAVMWARRVRGYANSCPKCGASSVPLSIEEVGRYRWVCVPCGWSSPWFIVGEGRLRLADSLGAGVVIPRATDSEDEN